MNKMEKSMRNRWYSTTCIPSTASTKYSEHREHSGVLEASPKAATSYGAHVHVVTEAYPNPRGVGTECLPEKLKKQKTE